MVVGCWSLIRSVTDEIMKLPLHMSIIAMMYICRPYYLSADNLRTALMLLECLHSTQPGE